jgi:uncharacterized protein
MYPAGNIFIPVSHGRLEAIIKAPDHPKAVALILHPHPLGGGTMHNKVVFRVAAALYEIGLVTLRINFRGVGQSSGQHDEGRGELDDVKAGLDYLSQNYSQKRIVVCGFSFGARVGLEIGIKDPRVNYLISIGTPLNSYDFSFLVQCRKPILFVHGERDEHGDVEKLRTLVSEIQKHTDSQLVIIPNAEHFFEGRLNDVKRAITDWVSNKLNDAATNSTTL